MSPSLPDDVMPAILCRVAAKDLLRFRSVSKRWRSLINSPDFIKLHLAHSRNSHRGAVMRDRNGDFSWVYLDDPASAPSELPDPVNDDGDDMVGSCNGLVVFQRSESFSSVALWNPTTRKQLRIRLPSFEGLSIYTCGGAIALGHDSVKDEYKLVWNFSCEYDGDYHSFFMVYSLKSKTWKRVEGLGFKGFAGAWPGYAHVGDAIHWIVNGRIFAFDVGSEQLREVPQPDYGGKVLELRGCLGLVCGPGEHRQFVVWMMKEYGVKDSWTKLLSVGGSELVAGGGDRFLLNTNDGGLVMHDLVTRSVEDVTIPGLEKCCVPLGLTACVESLVRLDWDGQERLRGKKRVRLNDFLSKELRLNL